MKPSVFVHSWTPDDVLAELGRHYDVDYANMFELGILPEEEIVARAAGKDGLVILLAPVPRAVFEDNAGTLKVCASVSVGTDNIDVAAATEAGVLVTNTAGVLDDAVADMAMGLLLAIDRLTRLDHDIAALLAPVRDVAFLTFHDAYLYFERRYGLAGIGAVAVRVGQPQSARHVAELRVRIRDASVRCLFIEPEFAPALVDTLIEGMHVTFPALDPLGSAVTPGPEAYATMLRADARTIADCLGAGR